MHAYNLRTRKNSDNSSDRSATLIPNSTNNVQLVPVNNWQFFTVTERTELLANRVKLLEQQIDDKSVHMAEKMNITYKIVPFSGSCSQKAFEFLQKFKSVSKFHEYSDAHQKNAFPLHLEANGRHH